MYAIGMCVDEAYLIPALVVLMSAAEAIPLHERREIPVRILTSDLPRARARTMSEVTRRLGFESFDVRWDGPEASHRIIAGEYISPTTYLRFNFTDDFLNRPYLLYLDADLLVLGDITVPFGQLGVDRVGLVRDAINHTIGRGPALPGVAQRWPALRGRAYFNAGVMWCPTALLSGLRLEVSRIMMHARQHIHFNDQDALNLWAARMGNVVSVAAAYNAFELGRFREIGDWVYRLASKAPQGVSPVIVHFVGPAKPWQSACPTTEAVRLYGSFLSSAMRNVRRVRDQNADLHPPTLATLPPKGRV